MLKYVYFYTPVLKYEQEKENMINTAAGTKQSNQINNTGIRSVDIVYLS